MVRKWRKLVRFVFMRDGSTTRHEALLLGAHTWTSLYGPPSQGIFSSESLHGGRADLENKNLR